jgi:hypothetical protein
LKKTVVSVVKFVGDGWSSLQKQRSIIGLIRKVLREIWVAEEKMDYLALAVIPDLLL